MKKQIIVTDDNSHTILIPELDETYHSRHGAIQEAEHVFIKNGIENFSHLKFVKVFEMGFGTGLNALLTCNRNITTNQLIEYTTIEKYPLEDQLLLNINYNEQFKENANFKKIHEANWNEKVQIDPTFSLNKIEGDILTLEPIENSYDIIYYDAFGPKTQPELWSVESMKKMYKALKPEGILVTYCAQGQFKRNLKKVGFEVINLPGPPGKREMTKAVK